MSALRQLRVLILPQEQIVALLRGELQMLNLPADASVAAACSDVRARDVGLRVHSLAFEAVPEGVPLPTMAPVFARKGERP